MSLCSQYDGMSKTVEKKKILLVVLLLGPVRKKKKHHPASLSIDRCVLLALDISSMTCSVMLSVCYIVAPTFHTGVLL